MSCISAYFGCAAGVKHVDLLLQLLQQLSEVLMFRAPGGDRIGHGLFSLSVSASVETGGPIWMLTAINPD